MKVIITAGGTGGHIYPAGAIINKIKQKDPLANILYIGTTDRMEKDLIPKMNIAYIGLEMKGLDRKNLLANISTFVMYKKAVKKAKETIKNFDPDVVIGCGGYVTTPVLYAAHKLKYKTMIHEQNSTPGVSNKFIGSFADKICVSLPNSLIAFGAKKSVYTGNPRSEEIFKVKPANKATFGLMQNKKLVIIVMGSLGSTTMTEKIKELIPKFSSKDYQIIIITGKNYYDGYKNIKAPSNVGIVPYLDNFINLLKTADLIVSRAGASTIAEITAIGLPSILIPSPYVTANHQLVNARELEHAGACKILEEKDFSSDKILNLIDEILSNQALYHSMCLASKSLGITDSAERFYNEIIKLIVGDK